jgi:AcrR family transcriptional regulator
MSPSASSPPRGRPSNREGLLDAALAVLRRRGAGRLTIESVAQHARTTKGGVMYHFKSKESLLAALVERARAAAEAELDEAARLAAARGCRVLEAYVEVVLATDAAADPTNAGIIGAAANEPLLLAPFGELMEERLRRLSADGAPPARVGAVLAALDGIWIAEALGLPPFPRQLRAEVAAELIALARGDAR